MQIEAVIFKEIAGKVDYQTFVSVVNTVKKLEQIIDKGELSAEHYETLRTLMIMENNAGWEDRHSQRIQLLNDTMGKICEEFEKFLP